MTGQGALLNSDQSRWVRLLIGLVHNQPKGIILPYRQVHLLRNHKPFHALHPLEEDDVTFGGGGEENFPREVVLHVATLFAAFGVGNRSGD